MVAVSPPVRISSGQQCATTSEAHDMEPREDQPSHHCEVTIRPNSSSEFSSAFHVNSTVGSTRSLETRLRHSHIPGLYLNATKTVARQSRAIEIALKAGPRLGTWPLVDSLSPDSNCAIWSWAIATYDDMELGAWVVGIGDIWHFVPPILWRMSELENSSQERRLIRYRSTPTTRMTFVMPEV